MDELTIYNTNFLNIEALPNVSNPTSILASDLVTHPNEYEYYPSIISIPPPPPPPPPPTDQTWPHLEKGESSTQTHLKPQNSIRLPKVTMATSNIPIQDQIPKNNKSDHRHQQAKSSNKRHLACQRGRRIEFREKMKQLKDLIPGCDKKDTASVLDDAIKCIKSANAQIQLHSWYQHQQLQQYYSSQGAMGNIIHQPMNPGATGLIPYLHYQPPTTNLVQPNLLLPSLSPFSQDQVTITTTVSTTTSCGK